MNDLITIKQLPIIEENLKSLSEEINQKVENANALVCTEETVKSVKQIRTDLSKEFKELEEQRKTVKNSIMKPYNDFEELYKQYVSDSYRNADITLKNKIDSVESEIKNECRQKLIEFFNEYRLSKNLDKTYLTFEELNINIVLGLLTDKKELTKKVKEEVINKVELVCKDIETIKTMSNSEEILVEYLKHKDLSRTIKEVNDRHTALEQIKQTEQVVSEIQEKEQVVVQKVEEILQAPVVEEKEYELEFVVVTTKEKLSKLKKFLEEEGIRYESK